MASSTEMFGNCVSPAAAHDMAGVPQPLHPAAFGQALWEFRGGRQVSNKNPAAVHIAISRGGSSASNLSKRMLNVGGSQPHPTLARNSIPIPESQLLRWRTPDVRGGWTLLRHVRANWIPEPGHGSSVWGKQSFITPLFLGAPQSRILWESLTLLEMALLRPPPGSLRLSRP